MKGEKMDRRSSFGNMVRKKFSDITNSLPQPKPPVISENSPLDSASAKEYIDHLVKENMTLAKIVHEKNKVLELSGIENRKLRTSLLMMRLHNWNLAQSNSQMLTVGGALDSKLFYANFVDINSLGELTSCELYLFQELSLGREKLTALQHDLLCKEALLKAKDLELKESEMVGREYEFRRDSKSYNANRSRSSKTRSLCGSPLSQPHYDKQTVESKRRWSRRRSASSRIQHQDPAAIFYDIDYKTTFPIAMRSNSSNHERLEGSSIGKPFNSQSIIKFNLTRKDQLRSR